ncbi:hypothetical protein COT30_00510, partial [Candidatus Micrarchaeota archaeon CG08_land_8_20_14_0_20_49_17]
MVKVGNMKKMGASSLIRVLLLLSLVFLISPVLFATNYCVGPILNENGCPASGYTLVASGTRWTHNNATCNTGLDTSAVPCDITNLVVGQGQVLVAGGTQRGTPLLVNASGNITIYGMINATGNYTTNMDGLGVQFAAVNVFVNASGTLNATGKGFRVANMGPGGYNNAAYSGASYGGASS